MPHSSFDIMNGANGFRTEVRLTPKPNLPNFIIKKKASPFLTTPVHIPARQIPTSSCKSTYSPSYTQSFSYSREYLRDFPETEIVLQQESYDLIESDTYNSQTSCVDVQNSSESFYNVSEILKVSSTSRLSEENKLLEEITNQVENLKEFVHDELRDMDSINTFFHKALDISNNLKASDAQAKKRLDYLSIKAENIDKDYKIYTADHISDYDSITLEEALEKLSTGLQTATIALYHTPREKTSPLSTPGFEQFNFPTLREPESFDDIPPLILSPINRISPDICSEIINKLQELRDLLSKNADNSRLLYHESSQLQKKIDSGRINYRNTLADIKSYETQLLEKTELVHQLSGDGIYSDLSEAYLQELCRKINKASRKIVTELALRDIRDANAQSLIVLSQNDKENCIICYERKWNTTLSPCGHLLCDECSNLLNYCPQCRRRIESRQRCFQP